MLRELSGHRLEVTVDETVAPMIAVGAGRVDEASMTQWLSHHLRVS
jgi:prophage maintenance system killer protein